MPRYNTVHLTGYLTTDAFFEVLDKTNTPYVRFNLMVLRDDSQSGVTTHQLPTPEHLNKKHRCDVLRVVAYGAHAAVAYYYLRKGAQISVTGWLESRRYFDKPANKYRWTLEVNAQHIVHGPGSDFVRGDAQRQRKLDDADGRAGKELRDLPPTTLPPEDLDELAGEGAPL